MTDHYLEVCLSAPAEGAAAIAERLQAFAPGGLALAEPYRPLGPDEGVRFEPWRPAQITIYLPEDERLAERRKQLETAIASMPELIEIHTQMVREQDWAEGWKAFFQVEHIGQRLVIRPSWRDYRPLPGEIVLDLDPGMAFGTGQHPTTRQCLESLESLVQPGLTVLDLGCGSGILSLAAAKLGARSVLALDIEPAAVRATRANAKANCVDTIVDVALGSLDQRGQDSQALVAVADLLVANISAAAIAGLAPAIARALRSGGAFLGSGIIEARLDEALVALAAAGLHIDHLRAEGDWRTVLAHR